MRNLWQNFWYRLSLEASRNRSHRREAVRVFHLRPPSQSELGVTAPRGQSAPRRRPWQSSLDEAAEVSNSVEGAKRRRGGQPGHRAQCSGRCQVAESGLEEEAQSYLAEEIAAEKAPTTFVIGRI